MIDEILKKFGLKYEELYPAEKEQLNVWVQSLSQGQLTVDKVKEHIRMMRDAVETELTNHNLDPKQDLFLKARLKNYMLLEGFLSTPERAKQQMERAIAGIAGTQKR